MVLEKPTALHTQGSYQTPFSYYNTLTSDLLLRTSDSPSLLIITTLLGSLTQQYMASMV